ncbi:hypothetical protein TNCT_50331 [Trichonephila clavata]|uniref:Uncharacterized protein n=1 Tax=Trichonephila clavata TaxID=2740835 RepID=A0A8X6FGU2_TRICU|nr:hypothetical protein TNCT_50331 [Trichonephila clavata]
MFRLESLDQANEVERSAIMKGTKRKCMASNIVRRSGLRKKLRTQEDETPVFDNHIADSNPDKKKYLTLEAYFFLSGLESAM